MTERGEQGVERRGEGVLRVPRLATVDSLYNLHVIVILLFKIFVFWVYMYKKKNLFIIYLAIF